MIRVDDGFLENAGAVLLKLRAYELDVFRGVVEAVTGAMNRDKTAPAFDELQQGLLLIRRNARPVGENGQHIITGQLGGVEVIQLVGIFQFDAGPGENRLQLFKSVCSAMGPVVAQEQDSN